MAALKIFHADNEVLAILNGTIIYDKKTEQNPTLNGQVPLDPFLIAGINVLMVVGINWGGPATFSGAVVVGNVETPFGFTAASTPNGKAFAQTFVIPK